MYPFLIALDNNKVLGFTEKPQGDGGWINGGFFVLSPKVIDNIKNDQSVWEAEPLTSLAVTPDSRCGLSGSWDKKLPEVDNPNVQASPIRAGVTIYTPPDGGSLRMSGHEMNLRANMARKGSVLNATPANEIGMARELRIGDWRWF